MNETMICIASGPSLSRNDCDIAFSSGYKIITVNNSWRMVPDCEVIYAGDCCWWEENSDSITSKAERWCGDEFTARRFGINYLPSSLPGSFNSGQRAIELAINQGAKRVILLGYDCTLRNGLHWHGAHPLLDNPDRFSINRWQAEFQQLRDRAGGVEIINCSPRTRLQAFPALPLQVALSL